MCPLVIKIIPVEPAILKFVSICKAVPLALVFSIIRIKGLAVAPVAAFGYEAKVAFATVNGFEVVVNFLIPPFPPSGPKQPLTLVQVCAVFAYSSHKELK